MKGNVYGGHRLFSGIEYQIKDYKTLTAVHEKGIQFNVADEWEWYCDGLIEAEEFFNKTGITVKEMRQNQDSI